MSLTVTALLLAPALAAPPPAVRLGPMVLPTADNARVMPAAALTLPAAVPEACEALTTELAVVELTPQRVKLAGRPVVELSGGALPAGDGPLVEPLMLALREAQERRDAVAGLGCEVGDGRHLAIAADHRTSVNTLLRVVHTARAAGFTELGLVVTDASPQAGPWPPALDGLGITLRQAEGDDFRMEVVGWPEVQGTAGELVGELAGGEFGKAGGLVTLELRPDDTTRRLVKTMDLLAAAGHGQVLPTTDLGTPAAASRESAQLGLSRVGPDAPIAVMPLGRAVEVVAVATTVKLAGELDIKGDLDPMIAYARLGGALAEAARCLPPGSKPQALKLEVVLLVDGSVGKARLMGEVDPALEACLVPPMAGLSFKAPADGGIVVIRVPLALE